MLSDILTTSLPKLRAFEKPNEGLGVVLKPLDDVLVAISIAVGHPVSCFLEEFGLLVDELHIHETADRDAPLLDVPHGGGQRFLSKFEPADLILP